MFTRFTRKAFSTLVVADHADGKLSKSIYKVLTAAKKLNKEVNIFLPFKTIFLSFSPLSYFVYGVHSFHFDLSDYIFSL